jgi:hypothetical protein
MSGYLDNPTMQPLFLHQEESMPARDVIHSSGNRAIADRRVPTHDHTQIPFTLPFVTAR